MNNSEEKFEDVFNYHSCQKSINGDLIVTVKKSMGRLKRSFFLSKAHGVWERPYFRVHAQSMVDPSQKYFFTAVRHVPDNIWNQLLSNAFNQKFQNTSV